MTSLNHPNESFPFKIAVNLCYQNSSKTNPQKLTFRNVARLRPPTQLSNEPLRSYLSRILQNF